MGTTHTRALRRIGLALALVAAMAIGALGAYAAGTGALTILAGGDGQQGATVTGDGCQTGDLTVTFQPGDYDPGAGGFMLMGLDLAGIDAACGEGYLALTTAAGSTTYPLTLPAAGAYVDLSADAIPVGGVDSVAVALFAAP